MGIIKVLKGINLTKIKLRKQRPRTVTVYPAETIFQKWLDENIYRFNHKPVLKNIINGKGIYSFEGIIDNITLVVAFWIPESMIYFDNLPEFCEDTDDVNFDHRIVAYIGDEKYHPLKGYYDADRIDDEYYYFPTQKELYINEVFEPIIEYCNQMFVPENSLYLRDFAGATTGFIAPTDEESQPGGGMEASELFPAPDKYKYDLFLDK